MIPRSFSTICDNPLFSFERGIICFVFQAIYVLLGIICLQNEETNSIVDGVDVKCIKISCRKNNGVYSVEIHLFSAYFHDFIPNFCFLTKKTCFI